MVVVVAVTRSPDYSPVIADRSLGYIDYNFAAHTEDNPLRTVVVGYSIDHTVVTDRNLHMVGIVALAGTTALQAGMCSLAG